MAAMVVGGSSPLPSSISIQEKGSRNKRKFQVDPPLADLNRQSLLDNMYESYTTKKTLTSIDLEHHLGVCDVCRTHTYGPRDQLYLEEFQDVDWSDISETHLEDLVLSDLDTIYKTAIKRITSYGYTEEVATNATLWSGHCYGCKDTVSNIVDNVLAFLGSGHEVDSSLSASSYVELRKFEKSVLEDMVSVVREVRPFFSMGDAMWFLLICDMNLSHACAMDGDPLNSLGNDEVSVDTSVPQLKSESNSDRSNSPALIELNVPGPGKPNHPSAPYPTSQTGMRTVLGIPNLPSPRFAASSNLNVQIPNFIPASSSDYVVEKSYSQTTFQSSLPDEKPRSRRKGHAADSKRDYILRKRAIHLERSHQGQGSKAILSTHKLSSLRGWMLDKKCKTVSDFASIKIRNSSLKPNKPVGMSTTEVYATCNVSSSAGPSDISSSTTETLCSTSTLPRVSIEISSSLASNSSSSASPKPNFWGEAPSCSSYAGIPSDKILGQWVPEDMKDEMVIKLVPRVRELLQAQLQEWTEWAQQKVMQAARRLGKDKAELQTLRQEKEEVARVQKENRTLEENTMKKLKEMEIAFSKASGHVEKANATVRRLGIENSILRQEMEAAKLRAAGSSASCQEASLREMDTQKKFQSSERQKALFCEELATERRNLSRLQQRFEQAKEYQNQLEARWRKEEKAKEEALAKAESERREREQIEVSAKSKVDTVRSKAEGDMQRYREEIRSLEHQIAKLRLTTDPPKTAPLGWGRHSNPRFDPEPMDPQESGDGDVQRDRECVMCLTEEMSVVFMPCAHQVVCTRCDEMHERQGMKDCPSCRTPIQRRIQVRSADS